MNLLTASHPGLLGQVPVPLHNTARGTGRSRLGTLKFSLSDSDLASATRPLSDVLSHVGGIGVASASHKDTEAGAACTEAQDMVLTAASFGGMDLSKAPQLAAALAALLRDARKRLQTRIRRSELRCRDALSIELARRWRAWFGVHAGPVVAAARPFCIDRVRMAFEVRNCRLNSATVAAISVLPLSTLPLQPVTPGDRVLLSPPARTAHSDGGGMAGPTPTPPTERDDDPTPHGAKTGAAPATPAAQTTPQESRRRGSSRSDGTTSSGGGGSADEGTSSEREYVYSKRVTTVTRRTAEGEVTETNTHITRKHVRRILRGASASELPEA